MPSVDGVPSVTEILGAVGLAESYAFLRPEVRERLMARGKALHLAMAWSDAGTLDEASLHPSIRPGWDAYCRFKAETAHVPEASEVELFHPHGFCGHLDRIGLVRGARAIIDWKYSDQPDLNGGALQLAGYGLLDDAAHPGHPPTSRYIVALRKDGTYRLHDVTDGHSAQVFTAALVVYRALKGRKG